MKKAITLFLVLILLFSVTACNEDVTSLPSDESNISDSDYESKAHQWLEDYSPNSKNDDVTSEEDISENESLMGDSEDSSSEAAEDDSEDVSDVYSDVTSDESYDDSSDAVSEVTSDVTSDDVTSDGLQIPEYRGDIFLVTADIAYQEGYSATLVCTAQGDVNLYFDNGTEFTGMGEKQDCLERGMKLIEACQKHLNMAVEVDEYTFPQYGTTYIYVKTEKGVFRFEDDNTEISEGYISDIEIAVINAVTNITKYAEQ